ncbi:unnamed protein product [Brachionus calyciflorus]|uniref:KN motif and ankyrin repeat domain-containing protein n=1 Tax=Brachionus calyciflorus TaxID=104777 RepID=A0A813M8M5_9BILA|nr:unnamed protein product [Brachionus calyciflorus]
MISNHNKNSSSFRIIEPRKFQHAQQIPVSLSNQQIPILSVRSNSAVPTSNSNFEFSSTNQQQQQYYQYQQQQQQQQQQQIKQNNYRIRNLSDTDSSCIPETTSESGISDLDMSEKCTCCPYGYHIDVDFVTFLNTLGGKNLNRQIKKIQRKRNEHLQKSMEYVIDEVEKIKQMNDYGTSYNGSPLQSNRFNNGHEINTHQSINQRNLPVTSNLKNTIKKIDHQLYQDEQLFSSLSQQQQQQQQQQRSEPNTPRYTTNQKPILTPRSNIVLTQINPQVSYSSLPGENYIKTSQSFHSNQYESGNTQRRSYSSCGEPINNQSTNRKCLSNRASPIRSNQPDPSLPYRQIHDSRRSRSANRRSISKSPVPEKQFYKREIKINLAQQPPQPPPQKQTNNSYSQMEQLYNDEYEIKTVTTTIEKPQNPPPPQITPRPIISNNFPIITNNEVQEEVLLNLFSCNNSGSISSDSSESLVEIGHNNLKINEVYEKKESKNELKQQEPKQRTQTSLLLEKKLFELEKKLQKIPELELKNNILLEEKQLLLKQLLNSTKNQTYTPPPRPVEPAKVYRTIGCDSIESHKRDVGIHVRSNTKDASCLVDQPTEQVTQMQTVITNLRDQLKEQTLILQQAQTKPSTRDVAVMHVVDKIEEPPPAKPELRDVAINHSTVDENKELVEKQTQIINTYIKEIEQLQVENCRLSNSLQELVKKHSKHVVTRGTHAPEQPVLYSVGTNTKQISTRDVQVMYTPKSRDVCLSTDRFIHTRDVALGCNIEDSELKLKIDELNLIKQKYELMVEENLKNVKSYRDVNTLCRLDFKESRDVSLGCNLYPVKEYRDVSLKCNLDEEFKKKVRDVCIDVKMDVKPEQKDANIYVNTIDPKPICHDFSTNVSFEDQEKINLIREIQLLKTPKPKRDVYVSVDHKTRLMEDLIRNNNSSTEEIRTSNKQINTDLKQTRDSSTVMNVDMKLIEKSCQASDSSMEIQHSELVHQKEMIEIERNKLIGLNSELRAQLKEMEEKLSIERKKLDVIETSNSAISTVTANVNYNSGSNISQIKTSSCHEIVEPVITKRREAEFEHHKITRSEPSKRSVEETVKMSASVSKQGEKYSDSQQWSNKTEVNLNRNEIMIPITNETSVKSKPPVSPGRALTSTLITSLSCDGKFETSGQEKSVYRDGELIERNICEKMEYKGPKSILKQSASSSKMSKSSSKALTFGENEILEAESESSLEEGMSSLNANDVQYETTSENILVNHQSTEMDDYEQQEVNCSVTSKQKFKQEEDANESNVRHISSRSHIQNYSKSESTIEQVPKSFELELELHIACAILNDSLYEPLKADKNKVAKALNLIQQDWFKLAAQKDSNPALVEEHLNAFYTRFSNLLLERIVNMADLNFNTALHYSVSTGNFEIVHLLLDSKVCDVNAQNKAGYTSIMLAAVVPIKDDFERNTLKRLFSEGNVNIKSTDSGQTALMLAVRHGNKDTVGLLLECSADCNSQDKEGSTALMAACEHGHIDIVRLLLDNTNCDPDIKDNDGETAFDIAKNKNRNDIIVLLYAHSSKLRSHHPAIQFSKSRPRIGSAGSQGGRK